jgi:MFS family permease
MVDDLANPALGVNMNSREEKQTSHVKVAAASLIGTAIEWYDFFLYGTAAALIFNKLFFPTFDPMIGTLLAFATYAVGFVARPVGGLVFGHYGDKIGRKTMLYLTLLIMGTATVLIGFLPTYETLGIWGHCCSLLAAWFRASAWVASGAAPSCWRWSMRPGTDVDFMAAGRKSVLRWGSYSGRWCSQSFP